MPFSIEEIRGLSVYVSSPTHRPFDPWVVESLLNAQEACFRCNIDVKVDVTSVMNLCELRIARSQAIDEFYKSEKEILAFIDSDICFRVDEFLRMLWLVMKFKCVAASYCGRTDENHSIFHSGIGSDGKIEIEIDVEHEVVTWNGVAAGLGFFFATREVIGKLLDMTTKKQKCFDRGGRRLKEPYEIKLVCDYRYLEGQGLVGDDHYLFEKIKEAGFTPWIWPGARLGHVATVPLASCFADQLKAAMPKEVDDLWK